MGIVNTGLNIITLGEYREVKVMIKALRMKKVNTITKVSTKIHSDPQQYFEMLHSKGMNYAESNIVSMDLSRGQAIQWSYANKDFLFAKGKVVLKQAILQTLPRGTSTEFQKIASQTSKDYKKMNLNVRNAKDRVKCMLEEEDLLSGDKPKTQYSTFKGRSSWIIGASWSPLSTMLKIYYLEDMIVKIDMIPYFPLNEWEDVRDNKEFVPFAGFGSWLWANHYQEFLNGGQKWY